MHTLSKSPSIVNQSHTTPTPRSTKHTQVNWVVDIGEASEALGAVLRKYNFQNLDEVFPGENTTTEFMCKVIFMRGTCCWGVRSLVL